MNRSISAALAAAALFGISTPLAKELVGSVDPLLLAGLLYVGSGVGLGVALMAARLVRAKRARHVAVWPTRSQLHWLGPAIFVGGVVGPVLLMLGLERTAAAAASLLLNTEAVLTALFAWFVFREHVDRRIAAGMVLIVAGGVVLAWSRAPVAPPLGALLIVGACACWALDNNLTRNVTSGDPITIACLKGLAAGLVNVSLAAALGLPWPTAGRLAAALLVGFLGYGVSLTLFVVALRGLGAGRTAAYFSVAPFVGAGFALATGSEPVTGQLMLASALMAIGVSLHVTERHEHWHEHSALVHEHAHVHDEHHRHTHDADWDGSEPHTHRHPHPIMWHVHPHFPDLHHRHDHRGRRETEG
jgi:drug/metabolite transporter (DMT)-like permease